MGVLRYVGGNDREMVIMRCAVIMVVVNMIVW